MIINIHINGSGNSKDIKADIDKIFSALECITEIPHLGIKMSSNSVYCNVQQCLVHAAVKPAH